MSYKEHVPKFLEKKKEKSLHCTKLHVNQHHPNKNRVVISNVDLIKLVDPSPLFSFSAKVA